MNPSGYQPDGVEDQDQINHGSDTGSVQSMVQYTLFHDVTGKTLVNVEEPFNALALSLFDNPPVDSIKKNLPLIKFATFGEERTNRGSLRHDENVLTITGIEADYDGEKESPEAAVDALADAGVESCVYTSFSHTEEKPRFRIIAPLSVPITGTPEELKAKRAELVHGLQSLVPDHPFAKESFNLSLSYFIGTAEGNENYRVWKIDGKCIDEHDSRCPVLEMPINDRRKTNGASKPKTEERIDDTDLIKNILTGENLHDPVIRLSARYAGRGMNRQQILDTIKGVMDASTESGMPRWAERYEDIERGVDSALHQFAPETAPVPVIVAAAAQREAIDIDIEPIGIMKPFCDYVIANSPRPQPRLALAGAMVMCGTAMGRAHSFMDTRPNLYVMQITGPGCGKESIRQAVMTAFREWDKQCPPGLAGIANTQPTQIVKVDYASGAAIAQSLRYLPRRLWVADEFGHVLQQISNPKSQGYHKDLGRQALTLFSASSGIWQSRQYTNSKEYEEALEVPYPFFSILGSTTPSMFAEALSSKDILSGLLPRILTFPVDPTPPEMIDIQSRTPLPNEVIGWMLMASPHPTGDPLQIATYDSAANPHEAESTPSAMESMRRVRKSFDKKARSAEPESAEQAMWLRSYELFLKVAHIAAGSLDPNAVIVTDDAVEWAEALVSNSIRQTLQFADVHLADTKVEGDVKRAISFIEKAQEFAPKAQKPAYQSLLARGLMPVSELARRMKINPREKDDLVKMLPDWGVSIGREAMTNPRTGKISEVVVLWKE